MYEISWKSLQVSSLSRFDTRNRGLPKIVEDGVYILWLTVFGTIRRAAYVGQGYVRSRLAKHVDDPRLKRLEAEYPACEWAVHWGHVPVSLPPSLENVGIGFMLRRLRDGVERYLADTYHPLVGEVWSDTPPVEVNLPVPIEYLID